MVGYSERGTGRLRLSSVLVDPGDFERILARLETTESVSELVQLRARNGAVLKCRLVAGARRAASGEVESAECVFVDLTEVLRLHEAIRACEQRYRSGFEQSTEALYVASPDGALVDANERWCERFGYTRDDLATLRIADMYASAHHREAWMEAGRGSSDIANEVPLRRKDGTVMYGQHVVVAARDEAGNIIAYHGTVRDVTDLRLSQILEGQERMFGERLMETSPACVLVFN